MVLVRGKKGHAFGDVDAIGGQLGLGQRLENIPLQRTIPSSIGMEALTVVDTSCRRLPSAGNSKTKVQSGPIVHVPSNSMMPGVKE
jgi:hypothetical protein